MQLTWLKGAFMLPPGMARRIGAPPGELARIDRFAHRFGELSDEQPRPLAVLMHGCFGIGGEQLGQARVLSQRGFVVFMPSHYGRPGAQLLCGGNAAGEVRMVRIDHHHYMQRVEELDAALQLARSLPFVDHGRTLVAGHSMGGGTLGLMKRTDVNAVVITGWGCAAPYNRRPPRELPLLAIRFADDPWLNDRSQCSAGLFSGRDEANTTSVMLDGQRTHEVFHDPRAVALFTQFVDRHFGQP